MINQGLKTGLEEHKNNIWWAAHKYNWNQVCNGALIIGALSIGDEEPQLASEIFRLLPQSICLWLSTAMEKTGAGRPDLTTGNIRPGIVHY